MFSVAGPDFECLKGVVISSAVILCIFAWTQERWAKLRKTKRGVSRIHGDKHQPARGQKGVSRQIQDGELIPEDQVQLLPIKQGVLSKSHEVNLTAAS